MKELIKNLSELINADLVITKQSKSFKIIETNEGAGCKNISFQYTDTNLFAFTLDKKLAGKCKMFPFFNASLGGASKVNDAIVFIKRNNEIFVLLIELKSNNSGSYRKQLLAGKNFSMYVKNILNQTFKKSYIIKENNIKCILFSTKKSAIKTGTKRTNIKYDSSDGLNITHQHCNKTFMLDQFLQ